MVKAQEWLDRNYPKEKRGEIIKLDISKGGLLSEILKSFSREKNELKGNLDLSDFVNLKELICPENKLVSLNLSKNSKLTKVDCSNNELVDIILPDDSDKLEYLKLDNNKFSEKDLSFLSNFVNLEHLYLSNNQFIGGLEHLKNMENLVALEVSHTGINIDKLEDLPKSLEEFRFAGKCLSDIVENSKGQLMEELMSGSEVSSELESSFSYSSSEKEESTLVASLDSSEVDEVAEKKTTEKILSVVTKLSVENTKLKLEKKKREVEIIDLKKKIAELEKIATTGSKEQMAKNQKKIVDLRGKLAKKGEELKKVEKELFDKNESLRKEVTKMEANLRNRSSVYSQKKNWKRQNGLKRKLRKRIKSWLSN